jgi:hypothetical protein
MTVMTHEPMVVNDLLPYTRPRGLRGLARLLVFVARHPRDFRAGWRPATNIVANGGFEPITGFHG